MIDWYSSYLYSRERQKDLIRQAEARRRIETAGGAGGSGRRPGGMFGASKVRHRLGEALVSLGQMLL